MAKKPKQKTYSWESSSDSWLGSIEAEDSLAIVIELNNSGSLPAQLRLKSVYFTPTEALAPDEELGFEASYVSDILANPGESVVIAAKLTTKTGERFIGAGVLKVSFIDEQFYPKDDQITPANWSWEVNFKDQ